MCVCWGLGGGGKELSRLKLPGHKVTKQLLAEATQGQSHPKLEMSIPDNTNDRRDTV